MWKLIFEGERGPGGVEVCYVSPLDRVLKHTPSKKLILGGVIAPPPPSPSNASMNM